jgi:predicted ATPase
LDALRTTGAELSRPWFQALLAETYGKLGRVESGLEVVTDALALIQKSEEWASAPELYRLQGEYLWRLHAQKPPARDTFSSSPSFVEEAEASFLRARALARQHHAKSYELRASTSLARLWRQQGKRAEARRMLAEIYSWFTEGLDTADLQEAKVLLDELSR